MNRSCQLTGSSASGSSKFGIAGSISNRISSSGGLSGLATTPVGTTSICGIRILPDWIALRSDGKEIGYCDEKWKCSSKVSFFIHAMKIVSINAKLHLLHDFFLGNASPLWPVRSNAHDFHVGRILRSQLVRRRWAGLAPTNQPTVVI